MEIWGETVVIMSLGAQTEILSLTSFLSRSMNEIKNLHYLPRASEPREVLFEDRTKAHADHVGQSFDWQSTAAVGVLKAVHFGEW